MDSDIKFKPNEKQQKCIDNTEGKFLVLAGPGTGKTFTIIQRIKAMISKGIEPSKILCLTYTDAAANEMKTRLERELDRLSVDVGIYTYHGFCYEIIERNSEEFELPDNVKIISNAVSRAFIKECIDEIDPKFYRTEKNDPYYYIDIIKGSIEEIKKHRLTKEDYFYNIDHNKDWLPKLDALRAELAEKNAKGDSRTKTLVSKIETLEKEIAKAKELWKFYELYQQKMYQKHYLDFNDIISFVLDKFENNAAFLDKVANSYEYLLVDEYQDTNNAQNSIVFYLTESIRSQNVFVVGDDDQIIYSFQGAKLDTVENFLKKFPDTSVICLSENMRSTQSILDVSRKVAEQDVNRLEAKPEFLKYGINKQLVAKNQKIIDKEKPVRCYKYADAIQECNEIISEIEELINSSECPVDENGNKKLSEIAILFRTNADLAIYAELLKERNIPFELKDGKSIFTIKSSIVLYFYLQALVNPELNSDKLFKLLLSPPFNINTKDYETICLERSKYKSFIELLRNADRGLFVEENKICDFIETFDYLQGYKANESLKNVVLEVGSKTGIFDYYLNSKINLSENIAGLKKIVSEACEYSEVMQTALLEDFVEYLDIALEDGISINTEKAPVPMNAVQLSTYYSAKGREYEYVYMPSLLSTKWESDNNTFKPQIPLPPAEYKNEEELKALKISDRIKVMYVGMTRAKHTLRLSYPQMVNGKVKKLSQFVSQIQDMLEKEKKPFAYDENSFWTHVANTLVKREYDYKKEFHNLVDSLLKDKYFSPTSINSYLSCPRQYLYNYILNLSSKAGNADNMHYGTAVHEACEFGVNYALKNGNYPSKEEFIKVFKNKLSKASLTSLAERKILEKRGEDALSAYYVQFISTPISQLYLTEQKVTLDIDGVKFKGFIDRVDRNPDGTYTIYDYKTGSAKGEKVICPEGEHEDYYNQIGLYKYYFEKVNNVKVRDTAFIFPEDFTKNLSLSLTEEDCEEIKNKFKSAIDNIKSYNFEPTYKKEVCKYCQYKDFCSMEIV